MGSGIVQRVLVDPFRVEYRTRDTALFADAEWGWGARHDAYVFEQYREALLPSGAYEKSAESHVRILRERGEPHAHAINAVVQSRAAREAKVEAKLDRMLASGHETGVIPEPEFETGGRPPIRRSESIPDRIQKARERKRRRPVDPQSAYERMEKEGLA